MLLNKGGFAGFFPLRYSTFFTGLSCAEPGAAATDAATATVAPRPIKLRLFDLVIASPFGAFQAQRSGTIITQPEPRGGTPVCSKAFPVFYEVTFRQHAVTMKVFLKFFLTERHSAYMIPKGLVRSSGLGCFSLERGTTQYPLDTGRLTA